MNVSGVKVSGVKVSRVKVSGVKVSRVIVSRVKAHQQPLGLLLLAAAQVVVDERNVPG